MYGASGVIGYYNEKNCDDYATLVTSRGNGSGDVFRTHHKQSYVTNNSFIARRNDKNSFIENEFTFQLFSNTDFKKIVYRFGTTTVDKYFYTKNKKFYFRIDS